MREVNSHVMNVTIKQVVQYKQPQGTYESSNQLWIKYNKHNAFAVVPVPCLSVKRVSTCIQSVTCPRPGTLSPRTNESLYYCEYCELFKYRLTLLVHFLFNTKLWYLLGNRNWIVIWYCSAVLQQQSLQGGSRD